MGGRMGLESIVVATQLDSSEPPELPKLPELPDEIWRLILAMKNDADKRQLELEHILKREREKARTEEGEERRRARALRKRCCKCCLVNWLHHILGILLLAFHQTDHF